jgi:hypothetical protein
MATVAWGKDSGADVVMPWYGNSVLERTRIVGGGSPNDDVALDWNEFEVDAHTRAMWRMNEGSGTRAGDSSGYGHNGTLVGGASGWSNEAWLGPYCFRRTDDGSPGSSYITVQHADTLIGMTALTLEWWMKGEWFPARGGDWRNPAAISKTFSYSAAFGNWGQDINASVYINGARYLPSWGGALQRRVDWTHVAVTWNGTNAFECFVNGVSKGTRSAQAGAVTGQAGYALTMASAGFVGLLDEVRISDVCRYTGSFAPTRYQESGTVTAQYELQSPYRLTEIGWAGTFGANYGLLTKLEVHTTGGWVTVAENPAGVESPITGLDLIVAGPELVRATLVPKADTLRSETPVLDWLGVLLVPLRQRPDRKRISGLLERQRMEAKSGSRVAALAERSRLDLRSD